MRRVYLFKKGKEILYIGKATSLKDRVRSYFIGDLINTRGQFIVDMVFKAEKIDYLKTDSVLEALILESNLIKNISRNITLKKKMTGATIMSLSPKKIFLAFYLFEGGSLKS